MTKQPPISKRLKELRLEAGLTQDKLGILAGIDEHSSSARVNQYEKAKHVPDYDTIQRFAKIFKVPSCYFYAEDDSLALMIRLLGKRPTQEQVKLIKKLTHS